MSYQQQSQQGGNNASMPQAKSGGSSGKQTGVVKFFNVTKGFGFITPDTGGQDIFVHQTNIHAEGFRSLDEGEKVEFTTEDGEKGLKAVNVTGPGGAYVKGAPRQQQGFSGGRGGRRGGGFNSGGYGRQNNYNSGGYGGRNNYGGNSGGYGGGYGNNSGGGYGNSGGNYGGNSGGYGGNSGGNYGGNSGGYGGNSGGNYGNSGGYGRNNY